MLKGDKFEFERGAAAKTENDDGYNAKENRHHDRDGTAGSRKSPASLGPVEILSKDTDHILGNRRLSDLESKLEQFTVNAGRAPEPVLPAHPPNELAQFAADLGTSRSA